MSFFWRVKITLVHELIYDGKGLKERPSMLAHCFKTGYSEFVFTHLRSFREMVGRRWEPDKEGGERKGGRIDCGLR